MHSTYNALPYTFRLIALSIKTRIKGTFYNASGDCLYLFSKKFCTLDQAKVIINCAEILLLKELCSKPARINTPGVSCRVVIGLLLRIYFCLPRPDIDIFTYNQSLVGIGFAGQLRLHDLLVISTLQLYPDNGADCMNA